jgi:hypothetical protein
MVLIKALENLEVAERLFLSQTVQDRNAAYHQADQR